MDPKHSIIKGLHCIVYYNRCSTAEQKNNIQEGVLKKEVKSQEQKTKDLEEVRASLKNLGQ